MVIKFLGTSSSRAIPRQRCKCNQCQSSDKKDKRLRSSVLINDEILIDVGPDFLAQKKKYKIDLAGIKLILLTHLHEDAAAGLENIYRLSPKTFVQRPEVFETKIGKIKITSFKVPHAKEVETFGFLLEEGNKRIVYISDISKITAKVKKILLTADLIIFDGSVFNHNFGGHLAIEKSLPILKNFKVKLFQQELGASTDTMWSETPHRRPIQHHYSSTDRSRWPSGAGAKIYYTHNGHTRLPHSEVEKLIQKKGGKKFHLVYDGMIIK